MIRARRRRRRAPSWYSTPVVGDALIEIGVQEQLLLVGPLAEARATVSNVRSSPITPTASEEHTYDETGGLGCG